VFFKMNFLHKLEEKVQGGAHGNAENQSAENKSQYLRPGYQPGNWAGKYDIHADVTAVHNAMKGVGTRERDLVAVLCERPNAYLQDLRLAYKQEHKLDLLTRIRIETSGMHQRMFEAIILIKPELRASYVHEAVQGLGTNELHLVDTLLTCNAKEMQETEAAYKHHHLVAMQARVDFDTSGVFQKLLDCALRGSRPVDGVHYDLVADDLITLFNSTEGKTVGTDTKAIIDLITRRSNAHLIHLNDAYKEKSKKGRTFVEEIIAKQHGYTEKAFCAYFLGPCHWTAYRLHLETKGHIKTDWEGLMRSIFMPTEDELKAAMRILKDYYKADLQAMIDHHFWNTELKDALSRYVKFVQATAVDHGERAVGNGTEEWQDPASPPLEQGCAAKLHQHHLSRAQKIGIGVGVGVGVAALVGGGILAYELHKKSEEKKQNEQQNH